MTSVIRIQISVCTSQDIGAPKRAINRDTLLVRENSIYVKKTRHPMIDSRNIDFYSPLVQIFYFLPFRAYSPGFKRIFLIGGVYSKVGRRSIRVCAVYDGATKEKENDGFVSSIHSLLLPGSHSARKCLGRVKTNSLFRAPPRNFATSSSAIWPIAIHGVSRVIIEPSKLFKLPSIVHATPLNSDL